jgi:hypothetical protein
MTEIYVLRGIERLMTVGFGGMSIYLGYRLFSIVVSEKGGLNAQGQGWKIGMKNIAPGVFFSFFGMVVLAIALTKSIVVEPVARGSEEARVVQLNNPTFLNDRGAAGELVVALTLVENHVATSGKNPDLAQISILMPKLTKAKHLIADSAAGPRRTDWYFEQRQKIRSELTRVFRTANSAPVIHRLELNGRAVSQ